MKVKDELLLFQFHMLPFSELLLTLEQNKNLFSWWFAGYIMQRTHWKALVIVLRTFQSFSVVRCEYTHSKESTPPASICRWFRVVMEVVRWRLAWSNCFMSRVISLTCAGTRQTGWADNPQGESVEKEARKEGGGQSRQKGKGGKKKWMNPRVVHCMMQYDKETELDQRRTHCFEKLFFLDAS